MFIQNGVSMEFLNIKLVQYSQVMINLILQFGTKLIKEVEDMKKRSILILLTTAAISMTILSGCGDKSPAEV